MQVLITGGVSEMVRYIFRVRGCDAWSCSPYSPCDGSEFHVSEARVSNVISLGWDLLVATEVRDPKIAKATLSKRIPKIVVVGPVSSANSQFRKPDQIVEPWMFGDNTSGRTCLWTKNLPDLLPTKIIPPEGFGIVDKGKVATRRLKSTEGPISFCVLHGIGFYSPIANLKPTWEEKTEFSPSEGIAIAMALQWGKK